MNTSPTATSEFAQADVTGTLGALWVFPIKSCAGIALQQSRLLATGLEWDRAWMVVDAHGQFITQRSAPHMALIQPSIDAAQGMLHICYPQAPDLSLPLELPLLPNYAQRLVKVWKSEVPAWDMGDEAAAWFTRAIGQPCRLVRYDPAQPRFSNTKWTGGIQAPNQFADGYPLLVTTSSAFEALNTRLALQGHAAVDGLRFRANIVIDGMAEHEEDHMHMLWLQADSPVAIRLGKPCSRCPIPNIDPATGIASPQVGQTIAQYRQDDRLDGAITFGMNAVVAQGAGQILRVGQPVGGQLLFA
ncbi:MAG: MOSC N-terminal beta barrel domain-containing protein [Comamonas sp.]|nr:MOSC N-terminal beta barrel domain-containing protein [Candidatus Comamonas equi]